MKGKGKSDTGKGRKSIQRKQKTSNAGAEISVVTRMATDLKSEMMTLLYVGYQLEKSRQ